MKGRDSWRSPSCRAGRDRAWRRIAAALTVAAGFLWAVWQVADYETSWAWMVGPAVMAGSIVLAGLWLRPLGGNRILGIAAFYAALVLMVCFLGADDGESLREILAVSGGSLGGLFVALTPETLVRERRSC